MHLLSRSPRERSRWVQSKSAYQIQRGIMACVCIGNRSISIDDDHHGQRISAICSGHQFAWIQESGKSQLLSGSKCRYVRYVQVIAYRENFKVAGLSVVLLVETVQLSHFCNAGFAHACPEVKNYCLLPVTVSKRDYSALGGRCPEPGSWCLDQPLLAWQP